MSSYGIRNTTSPFQWKIILIVQQVNPTITKATKTVSITTTLEMAKDSCGLIMFVATLRSLSVKSNKKSRE